MSKSTFDSTTTNTWTYNQQAAHEHLRGEVQADGRYRYHDDATRSEWIVTDSDLEDLGLRLGERQRDAYSLWCAATSAEEIDRG